MLTEIYIEVLLVDEELADRVWKPWDKGEIGDLTAFHAWCQIHCSRVDYMLGVGD